MFKHISKFFVVVVLLLVFASRVQAAELYFWQNQNQWQITPGQPLKLDLILDTQDESVNVLDGQIALTSDAFKITDVSDGSSFVSLWIKRPKIVDGKISFSGLIPGGLKTQKAKILTVTVTAQSVGKTTFDLSNFKILLNDGQGTEARLNVRPAEIISSTDAKIIPELKTQMDIFPPENFKVTVEQDQDLFNNDKFLVFTTNDKDSGLDHYEVREGAGDFVRAESPYQIKNQKLGETIIVRAIDKQGNKKDVTINPQIVDQAYEAENKNAIIIIAFGLILICLLVIKRLLSKK